MKELFCVGDRVVVIRAAGGATKAHVGRTGTVVHLPGPDIGVEFDELVYIGTTCVGHNCRGHCKRGYGRYCFPHELELLPPDIVCPVEDLL